MKALFGAFWVLMVAFGASGQGVKTILNELQAGDSDSLKIASYQRLVKFYYYSHLDSALYYANQGLDFARNNQYRMGEGIMLNALGKINEAHGYLDRATEYYLEAKHVLTETGYTQAIAGTANGLGVVAGKTGNYDDATKYFIEALGLFEKIGYAPGIVQSYIKLGVVNDHIGNLDKALEYYLKAEAINETLPPSNASLTLLNNIGIIYGRRNDIPTALQYFRKGLKASETTRAANVHVALLGSMGIAYEKSGKPDSALYFQQQALSRSRDYNLPEEEARALVNIASIIADKEPARSLGLLKAALGITERIQQLTLMAEVYEAMILHHKNRKDFEQALLLTDKKQILEDSLFSIQKSTEIASLQAVSELARQEEEMKRLAVLNDQSILQRNISIIVALILSGVIAIVWYFNKKISRLNLRLLAQQAELKNSNTIKDKLFSILGHDLRAPMGRVVGLLGVLAFNNRSSEETEVIEKLKHQSVSTLETLDNLLMWGKAQIKGIRLNQQTIAVKEQMQKAFFLYGDYAAQKKVTVIDRTPEDLLVHADASHFDFIVRNLLSNAIKFSHSGGMVEVSAAFPETEDEVVFAVKDFGVGIHTDAQHQIFTFGAESAPGTWEEKGTGIGLMLCREYVTENGGRLWLESEAGKGSTFYFSLSKEKRPIARQLA